MTVRIALAALIGVFLVLQAQGQAVSMALLGEYDQLLAAKSSVRLESEVHQAFQSRGAFILVQAKVDGQVGTYILDTGAPGLILNRAPSSAQDAGLGLNQSVHFEQTSVSTFAWGPLQQHKVKALAVDLSHFERGTDCRIAGIIGYEQLRQVMITINYPRNLLTFLPADADVDRLGTRLRFRLDGHLPVLRSAVGGKKARLGFDTGSGVNLLDIVYRSIAEAQATASLPDIRVNGVDAVPQRVQRISLAMTEIEKANWLNLPFALIDLAGFRESGLLIDGLLGREWMAERSVTIDYRHRRLYVK